MKFIACADLHITNSRPLNRKDDYFQTVLEKLEQILSLSVRMEAQCIVVAGDFFDLPTVPYMVTKAVLDLLTKWGQRMLVVPGQHDLRYHAQGLDNTPLGILKSSMCIELLHPSIPYKIGGVNFIGAGWNESPLVDVDCVGSYVLVMHKMVVETTKLFHDQTDFVSSTALLKKHMWAKCIITGDNHRPHVVHAKKGIQINCGSMMRSTKDQLGYEPGVHLVDTGNWEVRTIPLIIKPPQEVFDLAKIEKMETFEQAQIIAEESINEVGESLIFDGKRPNFSNVLAKIVEEIAPNESVKNIIYNVMEELK